MMKISFDTINEKIDPKINEQATAVEKIYFMKTDRKVNPKKVNPFIYLPGTVPVLLSAPHAVRHFRQKKIKVSDEFTGSLVYLLHNLTGCHVLAVSKFYGGDPNWDDPCIYKEKMREITREHEIDLILDIHGASREHSFDVDLGTVEGKSVLGDTQIPILLQESFEKAGFSQVSHNYFPGAGPNTVTRFGFEKLLIPAVQIEINRRYRNPHQNAESYLKLVRAFVQLMAGLSVHLK